MKLGFVFPGQGSQFVGMGKDLYENYEEVREIYQKASDILGMDISKLTFESTEEELSQTKNTQICILVMSLAILKVLEKKEIKAEEVAGLSLGEYTALMYGGFISFEDGIQIVAKRGKFMQEYLPEGNWSMAAILGLSDQEVEKVCQSIKSGFVVPANYNCPGQVVVSGEKDAVVEVIEKAKEFGAKRAIELKTSGPFHTAKLEEASKLLEKELDKIEIQFKTDTKVIKNINGKPYEKTDDMKQILAKHVISPVKFGVSVQEMINDGVDTFIEIGPGKTLSGFIKKINKEVTVMNIQDVDTLNKVIEILG